MSYIIAVTGKGGVGKTTFSGLLIKNLIKAGKTPVLAIDADPNSCLDAALGQKVENTIGRAREDVKEEGTSPNISTKELLQIKLNESLIEANGFDLVAMGRPEGAGCYCYANNVLKSVIGELAGQYPYVVLDNEAGLENLSRRIVQKVDMMVLVSDSSNAGLETLKRLYELAVEMEIGYDKLALVINRVRENRLPAKLKEIQTFTKADLTAVLPDDGEIAEFAETSRSFLELPDDNPVNREINEFLKKGNIIYGI
ncbi:MAG: AAA family ATPase [Oscillospiraceae bacterium]|nr:AAA family ATPase [Oscillospiraceae bacterium]